MNDQEIEIEVSKEANKIIESITACVDRGEGKGKCHVFLDHNDVCQCGLIDLTKARMK